MSPYEALILLVGVWLGIRPSSCTDDNQNVTGPPLSVDPAHKENARKEGNEEEAMAPWLIAVIVVVLIVIGISVTVAGVVISKKRKRQKLRKQRKAVTKRRQVRKHLEKGTLAFQTKYGIREGRHPDELLADQKEQLFNCGRHNPQLADHLHRKGATPAVIGYEKLSKLTASICVETSPSSPSAVAIQMARTFTTALSKVDEHLRAKDLIKMPIVSMSSSQPTAVIVRKDSAVARQSKQNENGHSPAEKRYLDLNNVSDYLGDSIMIGGMPTSKTDIHDYWDAAWRGEVGVLIWIGKQCIQLLKDGTTSNVGKYEIQIASSVHSSVVEYAQYRVLITHDNDRERREMTVFHIDQWPKYNEPSGVAKLVNVMNKAHQCLFKFYRPNERELRAMMVNCATGTRQSVSFVAMYICRQIWLISDVMNLELVAEHIRKFRYKAWALPLDELADEIRLVHVVLKKTADDAIKAKILSEKLAHEALAPKSDSEHSGTSTASSGRPSKSASAK